MVFMRKIKKIMIKGKRGTLATDDAGTTQSSIKNAFSENNSAPQNLFTSNVAEDFTARDKTARQRRQKTILLLLMGIVLLSLSLIHI